MQYDDLKLDRVSKLLPGFETANIVYSPSVTYIVTHQKNSLSVIVLSILIYASHVLEHIPWYQTALVLAEWILCLEAKWGT